MDSTPTTYSELVNFIISFIQILITALFALLFLVVVWKTIDAWVIHAGDPKKREEGKRLALTAVLVLVVMSSVWGIVALLRATFFTI
jgi:hypothetical protein